MKLILTAVVALAAGSPAFAQDGHAAHGAMDHSAMAPAGVQGSGVVKKIDAKAGSITLDHGPIAALKWPAMTMPFKAAPALIQNLKVGQKVTFTLKSGGAPEIIAISATK